MTSTTAAPAVTDFRIDVPQADLDDLLARVAATRLPRVLGDGSDETGFTTASAHALLDHWQHRFDWRAVEAALNELDHVLVEVADGQRVHVVRAAADPGVPKAQDVVLVHGWPDSFLRYRHLLAPLTAAGHDVYVPNLPGFAWSDPQAGPATVESAAEAVFAGVTAVGASQFAAHGGDWGSSVVEAMAVAHPEDVVALHLTDVPWGRFWQVDREGASEAEKAFLTTTDAWNESAAYITVQSTQCTTLALALADSPIGMAAWWAEKYGAWSDRPADLDEVLTQVCLTWFTRTEHSGMRYYAALAGSSWEDDGESWSDDAASGDWGSSDDAGDWSTPSAAQPTALAVFPADIQVPPREYAERFFDVRRFTLMPRGGHFGAMEEPELLAADLVAFLSDLRTTPAAD